MQNEKFTLSAALMDEVQTILTNITYGFLGWQETCLRKTSPDSKLIPGEYLILDVIASRNSPTPKIEIEKRLNRTDTFNIQYTLRKLMKLGFIEKPTPDEAKRIATYQATEEGEAIVKKFHEFRDQILLEQFTRMFEKNYMQAISTLKEIEQIYRNADRDASFYHE